MPPPPTEVNGWGRYVSGMLAALKAEVRSLQHHADATREHLSESTALMRDVRERVVRLEERSRGDSPSGHPEHTDWKGLIGELGTAARNLAILVLAGLLVAMLTGHVDPAALKSSVAALREIKELVPAPATH